MLRQWKDLRTPGLSYNVSNAKPWLGSIQLRQFLRGRPFGKPHFQNYYRFVTTSVEAATCYHFHNQCIVMIYVFWEGMHFMINKATAQVLGRPHGTGLFFGGLLYLTDCRIISDQSSRCSFCWFSSLPKKILSWFPSPSSYRIIITQPSRLDFVKSKHLTVENIF